MHSSPPQGIWNSPWIGSLILAHSCYLSNASKAISFHRNYWVPIMDQAIYNYLRLDCENKLKEFTNIKQNILPAVRVCSVLTGLWEPKRMPWSANPDFMAFPLDSLGHTHQSSTAQATLVNPWGHLTCGKEQALSDAVWLLIPPALFQSFHGHCWTGREPPPLWLHYILLEGSLSNLACTSSVQQSFSKTTLFIFIYSLTPTFWRTETWYKRRQDYMQIWVIDHTILRIAPLLWWLRLVTRASHHPGSLNPYNNLPRWSSVLLQKHFRHALPTSNYDMPKTRLNPNGSHHMALWPCSNTHPHPHHRHTSLTRK